MVHTVDLGNGETANFPDEMSQEDMTSALKKHMSNQGNFQSASQVAAQAAGQPMPGKYDELRNEAYQASRVLSGLGPSGEIVQGAHIAAPIINYLGRTAAGTMATGTSSVLNPENKNPISQTFKENLTPNAVLNSIPLAGNLLSRGAKSLYERFSPDFHAKGLLNYLGQGAQSLEDNAKSFAGKIRDAYQSHKAKVTEMLEPVKQKYGNDFITPVKKVAGSASTKMALPQTYGNSFNFGNLGSDINKLANEFKAKPTLINAHELQQQIGTKIGELKRSPLKDQATRDEISNLNDHYVKLNNHIDQHLERVDPKAAAQWREGRQYHKINVEPYRTDKQLRAIAEGDETNPKNVHNIFEYPTDKMDKKTKELNEGPIKKVISDLSPSAKGQIYYSKIGGHNANKTPTQLANNLEKAKHQGFGSYEENNAVDQHVATLRHKVNLAGHSEAIKNALSSGAGTIGGALLGEHYGGNSGGVAGGLAGGSIGHLLSKIAIPALSFAGRQTVKGANSLNDNTHIADLYHLLGKQGIINSLKNQRSQGSE